MTTADDILGLLKQHGPLTDAELRDRLRIRHQAVNQAARNLAEAGRIIRVTSSGTIVNRLPGQEHRPVSHAPHSAADPTRISEDEVKAAVKEYLERSGHEVMVAWGRDQGIDIDARGPNGRIIIEAKGEVPQKSQQQLNYFLGVLGTLVQRMDDPDARYGLALPDHPQYQRLAERLPALARDRLNLTIYFVRREEERFKVDELPPP